MIDYKGVIFDLDGTIIDSLYVWQKVDIDFFNKRGIDVPKDYVEKIKSMSFVEAAVFTKNEYGFKESVEEIIEEWNQLAFNEYSNNVKMKANIKEYLKYLKNKDIKIGLATASPKILYEAALKNNGIYDFFDTFTSGSEVDRGKEFPDIYLLTAERLGVKAQECIVFEDIYKAVLGAKAANMKVFGIYDKGSANDRERIEETADGYIFDFLEMI